MESILRATFIYLFLMIIVRISGNRTLSEMTTFDFVLLLIIGDASQQAIAANDYSIINGVLIVTTLIVLDVICAFLKERYKPFERVLDGIPMVIVNNGEMQRKLMKKLKIDECDILEAARKSQGLERIEQIKYAVLEKDGAITIIPNKL